jgi:UDP-N-acetylglucosamine--N-acetylmuramyl-(pentapeptide) pyrophosphoryl-undecaprenol N-acetylglucosamine transferase
MVNIIFIAGGTGGHLFPAIATILELQKKGHNTYLITDQRCAGYLVNYPSIAHSIYYAHSSNGNIFKKLFAGFLTLFSIFRALLFYLKFKPNKIVVFGGYTIFAGAFAAMLMGIELILHEQNIVLGKANKFFLNYASKIALTFASTLTIAEKYKNKIFVTGNPTKKNDQILTRLDRYIKEHKFFTILVIGGSQGAKIFAEIIPIVVTKLKETKSEIRFKVIQQARRVDVSSIIALYKDMNIEYEIKEFFFAINEQYLAADLVISRSGSGSIMDLIQTSSAGILIPLPSSADQHQLLQAQFLSNQKAAICIEQNSDMQENLVRHIQLLISKSLHFITMS